MSEPNRSSGLIDEFRDVYGTDVRVVESPGVERAVWIFSQRTPHLNREQAERLIAALRAWMEETERLRAARPLLRRPPGAGATAGGSAIMRNGTNHLEFCWRQYAERVLPKGASRVQIQASDEQLVRDIQAELTQFMADVLAGKK